jgi:hypothetical protein
MLLVTGLKLLKNSGIKLPLLASTYVYNFVREFRIYALGKRMQPHPTLDNHGERVSFFLVSVLPCRIQQVQRSQSISIR